MSLAATCLDLCIIILKEGSQRKTHIIQYHIYVGSKKEFYR